MSITHETATNGTSAPRGTTSHTSPQTSPETMKVQGEALAAKVRELLHEANVRRISVRNDEGHTVMEIPVTAGVVAAVVAPVVVAVAALAALANSWEIEIDRAPVQTSAGLPGPTTSV